MLITMCFPLRRMGRSEGLCAHPASGTPAYENLCFGGFSLFFRGFLFKDVNFYFFTEVNIFLFRKIYFFVIIFFKKSEFCWWIKYSKGSLPDVVSTNSPLIFAIRI